MKTKLHYVAMALCLVVVVSCSKESDVSTEYPVAQNFTAMEREVLDLVNAHRETLGQSYLIFSEVAYE